MDAILGMYGWAALAVFAYMTTGFVVALILRRNDIVDTMWGLGFVLITITALIAQQPISPRLWLVAALVGLWALRLALHIGFRNRGKTEDFRYAAWRRDWGKWFYLRTFFQIFMLQGFLMLVVAASIVVVGADGGGPLGWLDALGVAVWLLGFVFEAVGDWQLKRHIADPANKGVLMTSGLWRYTRHPNYFGEAVQWWGLWVIALAVPLGWVAVISPATITYLLRYVSGVPMLEKKMQKNPAWAEYAQRTSVFVPLPPSRR
jgi:steroid 5-alpha reductase family enzyme